MQWIFWLKLLTSQGGQFSGHLAPVSAFFFFCWLKSYSCAVLPWKKHNFFRYFSRLTAAVTAVDFILQLVISQLGQFSWHLAVVSAVFFCFSFFWLKSYNCVVLPWKNILFSANFHSTQLPRVPWIFCLKLLTSRLGQFSRHLAVVSTLFFFYWLKSYNCAVLPQKSILFSANFHRT